jgi:hypothetical protein
VRDTDSGRYKFSNDATAIIFVWNGARIDV